MRAFNIQPLDTKAMETCRYRIDNLTKPIYSLAMLETIAERFAGVLANPKPNHLKYGVLIVRQHFHRQCFQNCQQCFCR